eukprot:4701-Heterococcus_DN1.PRE.1
MLLLTKDAAACVHAAALSGRMMVQLADAVKQLEHWPRGVAVILRGQVFATHLKLTDPDHCIELTFLRTTCDADLYAFRLASMQHSNAFCAGADLNLAREHLTTSECYMSFAHTPQDGRQMCNLMTDTLNRLRALPMVSVAVVTGAAVGGGAELTTACDYRVLSSDAKIQFVQVKMGVSVGWGGGARLCKLITASTAHTSWNGQQARNRINNTLSKLLSLCVVLLRQLSHALKLLAWGYAVNAQQALAIGLADECQQVAAYRLGIHSVMTLQGPSWYHAAVITLAVAPEGVDAEETAV